MYHLSCINSISPTLIKQCVYLLLLIVAYDAATDLSWSLSGSFPVPVVFRYCFSSAVILFGTLDVLTQRFSSFSIVPTLGIIDPGQ